MVRDIIEQLQAGQDIRKNLIELKAECKEYTGKNAVLYALNNKLDLLYSFLYMDDPKIRKNAALILGQLGVEDSLELLYEAYVREDTLFVKSSYLAAMRELDYRKHLEDFKKRLQQLQQTPVEDKNKKHVAEEKKILQDMILTLEGHKKHTFIGWKEPSNVILLTNRNFREVTEQQLKSNRPRLFTAGVQAKCEDLEEMYEIRTFSELLFVLADCPTLQVDGQATIDKLAQSLASQLGASSLLHFLKVRHQGKEPFYFRIECKNKMDLKQKSTFTKKLAAYLQEETGNSLINSTSHYEVELRLVENKAGNFNLMIKLFTYKDPRFQYRREAMSSSIQPVNAALAMKLAQKYLKEDAQVLDPFCGVGTMLIERNYAGRTGDMYGIDIFGKGIEAARRNTENAKMHINYINRDFFDFHHAYLFDEVISNMPRVMGKKTTKDIYEIYINFWKKIQEHIGEDAVLVLYCYDREILLDTIPKNRFAIQDEFEISKKEGAYLYVIQQKLCNHVSQSEYKY